MVIDMQEDKLDSIERLEQFLEGAAGVTPRMLGGEAQRQAHVRVVFWAGLITPPWRGVIKAW